MESGKETAFNLRRMSGRIARVLLLALVCCMALKPQPASADTSALFAGGKESYNILLIGSDRRDDSWNGNSDVMILVTVLPESGKIVMTSFMRDLYADIPGYGVHKLNYAFAAGGADKLVETLEDNYDLSIDNYAIVDFDAMASIIDILGGVQVEVTDAEVPVLNTYVSSMGKAEYQLSGGGDYVLNGYQAVAYMRIRYVGNADYQRTQRQRDVLTEIFSLLQKLDVESLSGLADEVLTEVEHDVSRIRMIALLAALPDLLEYELDEQRVPYDGLYTTQNEMLVPDFAATIGQLHEALEID